MLHRATATLEPPAPATAAERRTVTVRLCRWNDPRPVVDDGIAYREQYEPGSVELAPRVHVADMHTGTLIGRALPDTLTDDGVGPTVDLVIARTAAGNDVLAQIDAGVLDSVSIEFEPLEHRGDPSAGEVSRSRVRVHGVAMAFRPAHDAPILSVRSIPEVPAMPDAPVIIDTPSIPAADPVVNMVDTGTLERALEDLRREVLTRDAPGPAGHPLALYRSLDDYATASWRDSEVAGLLYRALADQTTPNNPGVIPPAWVNTVYGIVDAGRPVVTAFGTRNLPASGTEVTWPYFAGDLKTLVGKQTTEKTAITSVRVDLLKGTADLETYAGGSDLSYQLIRRSSPSYREAYMRIMFAAYAAVTDMAAGVQAAAVATAGPTWDATTDTDGRGLATALFEASVAVAAATGSPASFALAASDVFVAAGGTLLPASYGTNNLAGTATAATLSVNVSGLPVIHAPYLTAGTLLVSNGQAGGWYEDGPLTVSAEDVEKLGQNVAVWGMAVFGATVPAGIVDVAVTLTTVPLAASTKSK